MILKSSKNIRKTIKYIYDKILFNTMKAIKINYDLRNELKDYPDEKMNYDAIINRLIHEVADYMPLSINDGNGVNINLHEDTMDKLKSYALTNGESYENILIRMLLISKSLNSNKL